MPQKRILTGDRPTGKLHLGHYVGTLKNRVRLQNEYECFFIIADLHMLTTKNSKENINELSSNIKDLVLDSLAAGINPEIVTFYLQSEIVEVYEIYTLLQNLITVPRLERLPSLKEMAKDSCKEEMPYGLLGYPVLQAADILGVKANLVPVGKDNMSHVEVTREVARRFNHMYEEIFPIPEELVGEVPTLVGTDGKSKMSKSLNNAIFLSDDPLIVKKKVFNMFTDPARIRADTPGQVEGNPVITYHRIFNSNTEQVKDIEYRYSKGQIGDVEVKEKLADAINLFLQPLRERREFYEQRKGYVENLIYSGTIRTQKEVKETMYEMKRAMGLTGVWNRLRRKAEDFQKDTEKKVIQSNLNHL